MPRRPPRSLRAAAPGGRGATATSTLLLSACPGPPVCTAVHTFLFVDGLDLVARSDSRMAGIDPVLLLRPGGPLQPADSPRTVDVAALVRPGQGPETLSLRIRLRGGTVIWSDLMYPGRDGGVVGEVRFRAEQYLGEIDRAYAAARNAAERPPAVRPRKGAQC
ncbi:hypothetical protein ACIGFK_09155 [Streptomyces sp. NPDC085524]|uniref:hypothetical protein n=1 Tax=unclassified Streptomyces TaxID=2593676 RepID=UPI0035D617F7